MKIIYLVLDAVSYEYSWLKNDLMKNLNQIRKKSIIVVSTLVILVPSIWWSIASIATRNIDNGGENTLNGLSYLDDSEFADIFTRDKFNSIINCSLVFTFINITNTRTRASFDLI